MSQTLSHTILPTREPRSPREAALTWRWLLGNAVPVLSAAGEIVGALTLKFDEDEGDPLRVWNLVVRQPLLAVSVVDLSMPVFLSVGIRRHFLRDGWINSSTGKMDHVMYEYSVWKFDRHLTEKEMAGVQDFVRIPRYLPQPWALVLWNRLYEIDGRRRILRMIFKLADEMRSR